MPTDDFIREYEAEIDRLREYAKEQQAEIERLKEHLAVSRDALQVEGSNASEERERAEKAEAECDELRRESAHKLAALARPAFDERDAAQERVRKLEAAMREIEALFEGGD